MKKILFALVLTILVCTVSVPALAQCSICTRTAAQMGEKPAKGINAGILYLAFIPFAVVGFISYNWWKKNRDLPEEQTTA